MHSKKNKPGGATSQHPMKVGFMDDSMKSPQGVPCGMGDNVNYLRDSYERAIENKSYCEHYDRPRHKLSSQEMYQGGYTFRMGRDKPPKMEHE